MAYQFNVTYETKVFQLIFQLTAITHHNKIKFDVGAFQ